MKTIKVYLNVYDFTPANQYLSGIGLGGYHTGVQINNKQYCFCVISQEQNQSGVIVIDPQSADYKFNRKIYLGERTIKSQQFLNILERIAGEFTCGKYHMFRYNCNHFSQEFVKELLGVNIPKWIFRFTNILNYLCYCLPFGLVSGQWALAALKQQKAGQQFDEHLTNVD